jgi:hypothetical protein
MKLCTLSLLLVCALYFTATASAQSSTTGQILGTITDRTGAVVPGAAVTLGAPSGQQRTTTTDREGLYRFSQLAPGTYTLIFAASGFAMTTQQGVVVEVTQTTTISPQLAAAGATTTVQVMSEAPLVDSTASTTGRVIGEREVHDLPLPTRNFQQLLTLSPGTVASVSNNTALGRGDSDIDVNGQQATSNNVQIDGIQVNSIGTNSTPNIAVPSPDAIREFIVQTSLYDATQGRNTGGNVAVVTRSGVNRIHGTAFEFFRNEAFNANDFFLKRSGQRRPELRRNQFGGTIGGPLWKDRTFLFLSYQGSREKNGASVTNSISFLNIPTGLTSDRSTATLSAYAASLGVPTVNTAALGLLQAKLPTGQYAIPSASRGGTQSCSGALCVSQTALSSLSTYHEEQFNINLDHNITGKDHLSARFFSSNIPQLQGINTFLGANPFQTPGFGGVLYFRNRVISLNETRVISPDIVNDFHAGFSRIKGYSHPQEPFTNAQFGINNPLASQYPGLATIQVNGLFTVGSGVLVDQHSVTGTFQFADTLTWSHGRQTIRIGGDVYRHRVDFAFNFFSRGEILVSSFQQFLAGGTPTSTVTGLLGNGLRDRGYRATDADAFLQDDIRVTPNLTVNAGLRFQRYGGFSDIRGRLVNFDPSVFLANHTTACTQAAPCTAPNDGFTMLSGNQTLNRDQYNVAPRVGFSLKPTGRDNVVVRGGFGIYFDRFSARIANLQIFNYPYDIVGLGLGSLQSSFPNLANLTFPLVPTVPSLIPFYFFGAPLAGTQTPVSGLYVDKNFSSPYTYQYNLGVQYSPFSDYLIEVGYVGAKGAHLINVATLGQTNAPAVIAASGFSSNKALNGLDIAQSNAAANYNSLQASLTKRFDKHLSLLGSYTYSKSLDNNSGALENELAALPGDQNNLQTQYGPSDFDRTQRVVISGVYDIGTAYKGDSHLLAQAANGWGSAMIATFQSGTPYSVTCISGSALYNRADIVPGVNPKLSGSTQSRLGGYFNTSAFKPSCANTAPYGTSSRNMLRGPGQKDVDFSVIKHFPISETSNIELRSELFNIFNFANFANPNNNVAALGVGTISATSAGPRVIQFALKANF